MKLSGSEHLAQAVFPRALQHGHHIEIDEIEHSRKQKQDAYAHKYAKLRAVAPNINFLFIGRTQPGPIAIFHGYKGETVVARVGSAGIDRAGVRADTVQVIQIHARNKLEILGRHPVPVGGSCGRKHHIKLKRALACRFGKHSPDRKLLAVGKAKDLADRILLPKHPARIALRNQGRFRRTQRQFPLHGLIGKKPEICAVRHDGIHRITAAAIGKELFFKRRIDGMHLNQLRINQHTVLHHGESTQTTVAFHLHLHGINLIPVDAMAVYRKLAVNITHQNDAAGQAERQSQQINQCV